MKYLFILSAVLLVLNLIGTIAISWWLVALPMIVGGVISIVILGVAYVFAKKIGAFK